MKKLLLLMTFLSIAGIVTAQVGINTAVPSIKSVFHIDAKGNNTSSTTITASQAADDILIDNEGCIGIGEVNPSAKVHINSTQGTLKPIRIADGSQGVNKYLFSDSQGRVTWKDKPIANGVVYYSRTPRTFTKNVYTELPVEVNASGYSRITIPKGGNYVFTLRWWGALGSLGAGVKIMSTGMVELRRITSGTAYTVVDRTTNYTAVIGGGSSRFSFTMSLFASALNTGDVLYLAIRPSDGYDWLTGAGLAPNQVSNTIYYPSVMVYNI